MAANPITDFDLGPLTWVKTEIDHSLAQARETLDKLAANTADRAPTKYILTHLHQATGALAMVGLGAATRFNEELEKLVAHLEVEEAGRIAATVTVAKRGISALSAYLDTLLAGQADHPMRLLQPYLELNRARGVNDAAESDLFHPNLSLELGGAAAAPLDEAVYAKALSLQRAQYQQGLLRMLKGGDPAEALRQMQGAMAAIESMQGASTTRAFWTAATALFDALVFGGLDVSPGVKPIFAKLDQQVKQLMDGNGKVAERLFRDLLLAVGRARPVSERIGMLKQAYRLEQLLALPEAQRGSDDEALAAIVREVRELTAQQKDTWLKYTSGNRAALEPFGKQAAVLAQRAAKLPQRDMAAVLDRLNEVAPALKARAIPPSEAQALEVATALLFLESALENYFRLGRDFPRQAKAVDERLKSAMAGDALPPMDSVEGGLLDEMTRRAQEKLLIFQVGQEVQVNLQNIEQVLDGFFRDASRRSEVGSLVAQFAQVQGALMIMELADAAALNAAVMARVQQFADGSLDGTGDAADLVADGLSALGLYVTALQQGATSPREVLLPALLRFGLAEPAKPGIESVLRRTGTVSPLDLDVQKQKVQALYEDWKDAPGQLGTREKLERAVDDLKRDASAMADATIARQSEEALQALSSGAEPDNTGVFRVMEELAPEKAPDVPTAQTVQLVDAPGAQIDRELLEIFLEEATEVVATIAENVAAVQMAPHDREALTTIRRGFHTLKGSGRMVGLIDLGEMAWQCEQVMNKWLKDEKPAAPVLVSFIELACESFTAWVEALKATGSATIDGTEITRRAEALKSDQPLAEIAVEAPVAPIVEEPVIAAEEVVAPAEVAASDLGERTEVDAPGIEPAVPTPAFTFESLDLVPAAETPPPLPPVEEPAAPATEALDFESLFSPPAVQAPVPEPGVAEPPAAPSPPAEEFAFGFDDAPPVRDEPVHRESPATSEPEPFLEARSPAVEPEPSFFAEASHEPSPPAAFEPETFAEPEGEADVYVGDIAIPATLFAIYLGEAEQHAHALDHEMARIEADPMVPVSPDFMRAAHTLCSTSRTTNLDPVARLASALEKWLTAAIDLPPEFDAHRLSVTRRAVDALVAMVQSIRGQAEPYPRDELVDELEALREGLSEARRTGEGTHVKVPEFVRAALAQIDAELEQSAASEALASAAIEPVAEPVAEAPPLAPEPVVERAPIAALIDSAIPPVVQAPEARTPEAEVPEADRAFEAGKDQRRIVDDLDRDLLPVFLEEARDIVPQVSEGVRRWKAQPADQGPVPDLQRQLHTLKGSARMTGLMRLGELAHVLETRVNQMAMVAVPAARDFEEMEERVDRFSLSIERLARGEDILEAEPIEVPVAAVFEHQKDKPAALAAIAAAAQERSERDALPVELREGRAALLRVNADLIDRFVNEAGELSIARSRIELEMAAFKRAMVDLTENIGRMRTQLREVEIASESQMQSTLKAKEDSGEGFDPLEFDRFSRMQELTRFLAESLGDVITLHQGLQKNLDETELAIHAQARLNRELQQGLMGVRLVPLGNLSDRFYRVVRQTAKELDKKANLELKGIRTELDRSVLEKITGPFEHLLRNAIAHGIEMPADRVAAGKPEIGEIAIDAVQRGNEVVLTIADDGAGLDFVRIREKAVQAGLLAPHVEMPESQLAQFIFTSGFSTAAEVSQVAGRGVGMDVVRSEITALGGRVDIASTRGRGATFTITLPLTLAVTQAVMLRAGTTMFAVPSVMVEQVQEYKAAAYSEAVAKGEIAWKDNHYRLRSLLPLLGEIDTPAPARQIPVLLLKSGVQRAAIRVDEIIGNREVVVKTIGPQLARLSGIAGATVLGNGQVVLILNPVQLVHRELAAGADGAAPQPAVMAVEPAALVVDQRSGAPLVMVVDDSLTVRKITGRMLAREGFEFVTAKDGVDALQQLQDLKPDCILLDVEMPRMDGFEFARNLRADEATRAIPIIMITSRTADKHRNRAIELGVNEYMGKPYQEDQLLALIRRYTSQAVFA